MEDEHDRIDFNPEDLDPFLADEPMASGSVSTFASSSSHDDGANANASAVEADSWIVVPPQPSITGFC